MNIGVIGLGSIAARHRQNLKRIFPNSTIIAAPSTIRKVFGSVPHADFVCENFEDIASLGADFAIVASPAPSHCIQASKLIDKQVPCLIEKPLSSALTDGCHFKAYQENRKVFVGLAYQLRFYPGLEVIIRFLNERVLGCIYNVNIEVGQYLPTWRPNIDFKDSVSAKRNLGGGVLLELSHEIDYAIFLFGGLRLFKSKLRSSIELGLEVEDIADLILEDNFGALINIHLNMVQKAPSRKCRILGSKGKLEWDLLEDKITVENEKGLAIIHDSNNWDKNNAYIDMIRAFTSKTTSNRKKIATLEEGIEVLRLIEEVKKQNESTT